MEFRLSFLEFNDFLKITLYQTSNYKVIIGRSLLPKASNLQNLTSHGTARPFLRYSTLCYIVLASVSYNVNQEVDKLVKY